VRFWLATIASLLLAGCTWSAQTARQHAERGDAYLAAGQVDAAVLEYRNAVKQASGDSELYCRLGDAYVAAGKTEEAYRAYTNAIDVDPSQLRARVEAGRLLLGARLYDQAQLRAEQVIDRDPLNVDAIVLRYRAIGEAALAAGDETNAEAAFRSATVDAPNAPEAYVALAQFLISAERQDEAEPILRRAVDVDPHSELANRALASFYLGQHRAADAERYLIAAAAQPHQRFRSTLALADYYYAAHRYREARTTLERAAGDAARVRLAAIDYETGATTEARRTLDKVLKKRPPAEGLALNARLLADEKKTEEALQAARAALAIDPALPAANYVIGSIAQQRGELDDAEHAFEAVLRVLPGHLDARVRLAEVQLDSGQPGDALSTLDGAPATRLVRMTFARALLANGQTERGRKELTALAAESTTDPEPDIALGTLDLDAGDTQAAAVHSARALRLAPSSPAALQLAGRVAFDTGDLSAAVEYLTRAVAQLPDAFDPVALLAHVYAEQGDAKRARTLLEQFAARHPDAAAPRTAIGVIAEAAGQLADAQRWYEQALTIDSREPVAAAALARLYLADPSRIERAVDLARTAATRAGDQADVHDTLGWAYFKSGRTRSAVAELERAVALDSANAGYRDHLSEARRALAAEIERNNATALIRR
jgi:tetratricopeptide (TPR) repeat protein